MLRHQRRITAAAAAAMTAACIAVSGTLAASATTRSSGTERSQLVSTSPLQTVTGSFTELPPSFTVRQAGANIFVDFSAPVGFSGGITGTAASTGTETIHPTGDFTVRAVVTCTCSVAGRSGELALLFTGTGSFPAQEKQGQFTVSGSGGLAGIHGEGTFTQSALAGSYVAEIHFEP
jgi:hypothetical protein